jgi:hypothetical protein
LYQVNFEARFTFKPFFQTAFALSQAGIYAIAEFGSSHSSTLITFAGESDF